MRRLAKRGDIASKRDGPREVRLLKSSIHDYKRRMEQAGTGKFSPVRDGNGSQELVLNNGVLAEDEYIDGDSEGDESEYFDAPLAIANEAVASQFVLTDCLELLVAPPLPCVMVERLINRPDVEELLRAHKIMQFFSTLQAADYITRHLGLKRVDTGRPPMLSHGDNLILAQVKKGTASLSYVLVQFAF